MQRRKFIKETTLFAIGVSAFGNVAWSKNHFTGDTATTTDILGPYYRPGAPFRININPKNYSGQRFHISGIVFKEDGKTPFQNCLVEIWQCDENKLYDNISDEFRYRGSQRTGKDGKYHFIGMHPVPYPVEGYPDIWRPAHFHLLISGEGQQDLITQVYLEKDPYLQKDLSSSSPQALKRILKITRNNKNEEAVRFDVVMAKEFKPDRSVFEKLVGVYKMNDQSMIEFYRDGDLLMLKWNSQIREGLSYKGNNTFGGGIRNLTTASFQLQTNNEVRVKVHFKSLNKGEFDLEGIKTFKYSS
jgi:protocatechuate 3,4-dioxygenase beta subunit